MILGIDIGYGDVKVSIGNGESVTHLFKFSSAIARAKKALAIRDARIVELTLPDGEISPVYVGNNALDLPSKDIIDITDYAALEAYAPAFIHTALEMASVDPLDIKCVVSGLSVAQLDQSGYFKERIKDFVVNGKEYHFDQVFLLPQGAGSKLAFDKYGDHFPEARTESNTFTFVGCDIGFNTLDLFYVTRGKTSPNLFEGIQQEGVMRIANNIRLKIKETYERDITLREAKEILDSKSYKFRGNRYDMSAVVDAAVVEYKERILQLIEEHYGDIIDKCDFVCLLGGGAPLVAEYNKDPFFKAVKSGHNSEFYNSIGFYLYGASKQ